MSPKLLYERYCLASDKDQFCRDLSSKEREMLSDRLCRGSAYSEHYLALRELGRGTCGLDDPECYVSFAKVYVSVANVAGLNKNETAVLRMLLNGFTVAEIAKGLEKTTVAIYKRIYKLKDKLDSNPDACIKAVLLEVFGCRAISLCE